MKRLLIIALGLSLCASAAFGQAGAIGLYVDPGFVTCDYVDAAAALVPVYAVHKFCPGATASQWRMVLGGGFNCIYTGEMVHMPVAIGSTQAGISIGYGGCLPCDILLVTINWFCQGISPTCASLEIVPDLAEPSGNIIVVGCDFVSYPAPGFKFYMNPDGTCNTCGIPTKETTWGKVKSLY